MTSLDPLAELRELTVTVADSYVSDLLAGKREVSINDVYIAAMGETFLASVANEGGLEKLARAIYRISRRGVNTDIFGEPATTERLFIDMAGLGANVKNYRASHENYETFTRCTRQ